MNKKLLSTLVLVVFSMGSVLAQCTVNSNMPPGFTPDPNNGENMDPGQPNQQYSQEFHFKVPKDTTVTIQGFTVTAEIDSLFFHSFEGLPNGLTMECSNTDCFYDSLEAGCLLVSGLINDTAGIYKCTLNVVFYGTANTQIGVIATETVGALPFAIYNNFKVGDVGVEDGLQLNKFDLVQNFPNPFDKKTQISFSSDANKSVDFKVFNVLGGIVKEQKIDAKQGLNKFDFVSEDYPSGVYFYSLSDGDKTLTRRMVIK